MTDESNVTKKVVESARTTQAREEAKLSPRAEESIKVSTGVVFKVKEVPQVAYADLRNSLPEPVPPIFYNPDYDREEPNENDPRYLAAKANWEIAMSSAVMNINILFGSEIENIPESIPAPDSEEFKEKLVFLLKTMGWSKDEAKSIGKLERYLFWVKYEACKGKISGENSDLSTLFSAIGRASGVPEEDVAEAIEKFRD